MQADLQIKVEPLVIKPLTKLGPGHYRTACGYFDLVKGRQDLWKLTEAKNVSGLRDLGAYLLDMDLKCQQFETLKSLIETVENSHTAHPPLRVRPLRKWESGSWETRDGLLWIVKNTDSKWDVEFSDHIALDARLCDWLNRHGLDHSIHTLSEAASLLEKANSLDPVHLVIAPLRGRDALNCL